MSSLSWTAVLPIRFFLVHQPNFHTATKRYQVILEAKLSMINQGPEGTEPAMPTSLSILVTNKFDLSRVMEGTVFDARIKSPHSIQTEAIIDFDYKVTVTKIIKESIHFSTANDYPDTNMPFYIFGKNKKYYIVHQIERYPKIQLCARVDTTNAVLNQYLDRGNYIFTIEVLGIKDGKQSPISEKIMQPFPADEIDYPKDFFFKTGTTLMAAVPETPSGYLSADLTLDEVYTDSKDINHDPNEPEDPDPAWIEEFRKVGQAIDGVRSAEGEDPGTEDSC
jgi:hypothetical protein